MLTTIDPHAIVRRNDLLEDMHVKNRLEKALIGHRVQIGMTLLQAAIVANVPV